MKILQESWNGRTYYIEAQMTIDPKEVSQRVAKILDDKQKEKEREDALKREKEDRTKAEQARVEVEKKAMEERAKVEQARVEAEKKAMEERDKQEQERFEARIKEMARKKEEWDREQERLKELERQRVKAKMEEVKRAKGWYQPKAFRIGGGYWLPFGFDASVGYTRNTSPNFGFDVFKLSGGFWNNYDSYYRDNDYRDVGYFQLLTGLRFATNSFGENKSTYFYTSVRAGIGIFGYDTYKSGNYYTDYEAGYPYGSNYYDLRYITYHHHYYYSYEGFAFAAELEAGFHFKYFFLGAAVNLSFFTPDYIRETYTSIVNGNSTYTETKLGKGKSVLMPLIGLRLGVDIGRSKLY
jgi:hypothetical protein